MKKTSLIFISLILLFLSAPKPSMAGYGDVCNLKKFGVGYSIHSTLVTITANKTNTTKLQASLECDGVTEAQGKVDCTSKICKITLDTAGYKGNCNIYVIRTKPTDNNSYSLYGEEVRCSIPVQTVYISSISPLKIEGKKISVRIKFNRPLTKPDEYTIESDCYQKVLGGNITLSYVKEVENNTYIFSTTDYYSASEKIGACSITVYSPSGGKVITQKEAIKEAEEQEKKTNPNDPCSLLSGKDYNDCRVCMGTQDNPTNKVWTVFGCIDMGSSANIFSFFFNFLSYMVGGIAALLLIYASFLYMTSSGDSEKIKRAQALITAIVSGILFIIFSIMIMRFIGLTLFDLPTLKSIGTTTPGSGGFG